MSVYYLLEFHFSSFAFSFEQNLLHQTQDKLLYTIEAFKTENDIDTELSIILDTILQIHTTVLFGNTLSVKKK